MERAETKKRLHSETPPRDERTPNAHSRVKRSFRRTLSRGGGNRTRCLLHPMQARCRYATPRPSARRHMMTAQRRAHGIGSVRHRALPVRPHVPSADRIWLDALERAPDVPELGSSRYVRIGMTLESTAWARRTAWGLPPTATAAGDVDPNMAGCPRSLSAAVMEPGRVYPIELPVASTES